ncbi:hypothetical protein GOP47_0002297 [Adiantum capillus-veneris]|uniref:Pentatricopeptide repeat-containing protein n=1 Tax=Adiantum capillus-veneris TaxID=13818 RepID=A0A9D4ZP27_ADICA|nr:hypothetical protein GOP47_0002297 [Adiantum capillus-veneris]
MIQVQRTKPSQQWTQLCNVLTKSAKQKDLEAGSCIHQFMVTTGLDREGILRDHLIRLYACCGCLEEARLVFCMSQVRSVYTWNSIISAHAKLGNGRATLHLYACMLDEGVAPDNVTFLCILKACATLTEGMLMHTHVIFFGLNVNSALGSALVECYALFGRLDDAQYVFDRVNTPDVVLWGTIISAYAQHFDANALELFNTMHSTGAAPSHFILNCTLKVCASTSDAQILHDHIMRNEFDSDLILGSSLVDAYAKLGDLDVANCVFNKLAKHDVVSWGALIDGYARHDCGLAALELFCQMEESNIKADSAIFLSVLEACAQIRNVNLGRKLHEIILKNGFHVDILIMSSLVNLYAVCGYLDEAHGLFDTIGNPDVVSWGVLVAGYVQHGFYDIVMELVAKMLEENMEPDDVILLSVLKACGGLAALSLGWRIHDHILRKAFVRVLDVGNVLVNMYVECGSLKEARKIFDMLSIRDEETWGVMIAGYVQEGDSFAAFWLLEEMLSSNLKPDKVILLSVLKACTIIGAAGKGMLIHDQVIRNGFETEAFVSNMLVHMYASCKSFNEAQRILTVMPQRDVVSWSALITGLVSSGKSKQAEELLKDMLRQGLKPDDTAVTIILSAYAHTGAVEEGLRFYKRMRQAHPTLEHVNCLLDLFSRSGRLSDATELSQAMPFSTSAIAETALLTGSKSFGDVELGRCYFDHVTTR